MVGIILFAAMWTQADAVLFYRSTVAWDTGGLSGRRAVPVYVSVDMDQGRLKMYCGAPQQGWCWNVNGRYIFFHGSSGGSAGGSTIDTLNGQIDSTGTLE